MTQFFDILLYEEVSVERFKDGKLEHAFTDLPLKERFHVVRPWRTVLQPTGSDAIEETFSP